MVLYRKNFDAYKYLGAHVEEKRNFSVLLHPQPPASL